MVCIKIKILLLIVLLLLAGVSNSMAQEVKYSDRCKLSVADITGLKTFDDENEDAPKIISKELGTFDTVLGEEKLTTKSFRLPKTKLCVVASIFYTDESMAGENSQDSASLELIISSKPKRDVLSGLQFSEAEVLVNTFEVARVTTIYKMGRRSFYIEMECRKQTRP